MGKCTIQGIDWSFAQQRWIIEKDLSFQCLSLLEMSIPNFSSSLQSGPWSAFSQASTYTVSKLIFGCFGLNLWKCQKYVCHLSRNQLIVQKSKKIPLISANWNKSIYCKVASSAVDWSSIAAQFFRMMKVLTNTSSPELHYSTNTPWLFAKAPKILNCTPSRVPSPSVLKAALHL